MRRTTTKEVGEDLQSSCQEQSDLQSLMFDVEKRIKVEAVKFFIRVLSLPLQFGERLD